MSDERIIAFYSTQCWEGGKTWTGFILLSPDECEKLENALRLARTGKLGEKKPVVVKEHKAGGYDQAIRRTTLTLKSYIPREEEDWYA